MEIDLMGVEVEDMLKAEPKPEPKPKKARIPRKKKATITIGYSHYSTSGENFKEGDKFISVDFTGHNEGSGSPCGTEAEADKHIEYLKNRYQDIYDLNIIDNRCLYKWRDFLVKLCEERGQEIDKIWFDVSTPYDNELAIRLAGHKCWSACVEFRFEEGKLKAYDSHFGGGTSMIETDNEEKAIREIMEKVFKKECSNSSWEDGYETRKEEEQHRKIVIDDEGWITKDD